MIAKLASRSLSVLCLGVLSLGAFAQSTTAPTASKQLPSNQAIANYGKLPLAFEPNRGQTSGNVQWLARGAEYTLFLAGHDAVLEMNRITPAKVGESNQPSIDSSVVRMNLVGASAPKQANGQDALFGKANYFTGKKASGWQRDVPMYGKVHMQAVYPGIDVVYYGHRGELEYDFVVSAGADPSAIKLTFDGAKVELAANGDLILPVTGSTSQVRFDKPVVYQMKNGVRQLIEGSFIIAENQQVSFKLGAYDKTRELVIDPTLLFQGALGTGNQQSVAEGMAVDASGEIVLTGITNDLTFPVTAGALQPSCSNDSAVAAANGWKRCGPSSASSGFVTKISADGTSLVYSTYLHGLSGAEYGYAVAVDSTGATDILGMTSSNDFPITSDAYQSLCQPYYPEVGFNNPPIFAPMAESCVGFFDGGGTEYTVQGPTLFVVKLSADGSQILYGTFFGGTIPTYPVALALDSSDNMYFTSFLQSAEPANNVYPNNGTIPFPVTTSAYQSVGVGPQSATLSKLSADGHTLMYSTLFGSLDSVNSFYTQPLALAVGPNGMAYLGGLSLSSSVPTTPGVVRTGCVPYSAFGGGPGRCADYTGFLSAFNTTQSGAASLAYSTYIGGAETPIGNAPDQLVEGLAADSQNNVYVTGYTLMPTYPTTAGAYQTVCPSNCNTAFLTKLNPTGTAYLWSTLFGGTTSSSSTGNAIALDAKGRVYLYGYNNGYGNDLPEVNSVEPTYIPASTAFVATFTSDASQLLFATRLGNTGAAINVSPITNNGIALDSTGNIYFAAYGADGGSFVTTPGTYATTATSGFNRTYFGKISPVLEPTTTSLTISAQSSAVNQPVTFTATVAGTIQTTPAPTGSVTLTNTAVTPNVVLGTIQLSNGTGSFTTSQLAVGSYTVTATYSADSEYAASTSNPSSLTIANSGPAAPVFSPAPGFYTLPQLITITDTTPGAIIYYVLNEKAPVKYTQPFALTGSDTIQAVAIVPASGGYTESPVVLAAYDTTNPPPATPMISPAGGTFTGPQPVTITDTTAGVTLYYSVNGGSPQKYSVPVNVGVNETIQAVAIGSFGTSYSESAVATASFIIH